MAIDLKKRDYLLYIENDRVKGFDLGDHSQDREIQDLCRESGCPVVGFVYDDYRSACQYGETNLRGD